MTGGRDRSLPPPQPADGSQLETFYRKHLARPEVRRRWDLRNPGNERARIQLDHAIADMLEATNCAARRLRVMEAGCGAGGVLERWRAARSRDWCVGVDLLLFRLELAAQTYPGRAFVCASADQLPFADETVDVVLAFTLFSSILEPAARRSVAREMDRVLKPGGSVLLYDFRVRRPGTSGTRGVRLREIRGLFANYKTRSRTLTLLPPLARALGPAAPRLYGPLATVPFLRTHRLAMMEKPTR